MPKPSIQTTLSADTTQAARLRRWVVIVGVVAMVANAGAAAFDAWRSYRQTIGDTRRELENAARILAAQIGDSFRTIDVLLRDTADWYSHGGALTTGRDAIDAALTSRAEGLPQLLRMSISNVDGLQQYSSRQGLVAEPDVSDRSVLRRTARQSRARAVRERASHDQARGSQRDCAITPDHRRSGSIRRRSERLHRSRGLTALFP